MLRYALIFLVVALIAAFIKLGTVVGCTVEFARILFGVSINLFLIIPIMHLAKGGTLLI